MSRVNEKQKKVLFTQSTMCVNDEVTTSFYSSNVAMEKKHSSGKNAPADEFSSEVQVSRVEVKFNRMALNKNIAKNYVHFCSSQLMTGSKRQILSKPIRKSNFVLVTNIGVW